MHEIHPDIYHICKTNIDIVELEIFKFIKIAIFIYFLVRMCLSLIQNLYKSIKIGTNPDIEESIYHTLHTQKFYLQIGFPAESPFYGNIVIYQLNLRLQHSEIWISNIGAQKHHPQQELLPILILTPPYMQVPPHGPGSGA